MGKLINRIPGSSLLISSLPGSALKTHVQSLGKPRDVNMRSLTSELWVRLVPFNWFKPSSKIFY